jgi:hypothetical protein
MHGMWITLEVVRERQARIGRHGSTNDGGVRRGLCERDDIALHERRRAARRACADRPARRLARALAAAARVIVAATRGYAGKIGE